LRFRKEGREEEEEEEEIYFLLFRFKVYSSITED
jgi:hypothetical protein